MKVHSFLVHAKRKMPGGPFALKTIRNRRRGNLAGNMGLQYWLLLHWGQVMSYPHWGRQLMAALAGLMTRASGFTVGFQTCNGGYGLIMLFVGFVLTCIFVVSIVFETFVTCMSNARSTKSG